MGHDLILQVSNLTKVFTSGGIVTPQSITYAVNNVSFSLKQGEILGLLGPNGSGKTTTIYMLIGALQPTSGTICYFGLDFSRHRSAILQYIGFASSAVQLPATLSVYQNLDIHARLYGLTAKQRTQQIEHLLKAFNMWHMRFTKARHLSHGQATRIMLAKAFLTNPRIVLLDEATAPLDPEIAQEMRRFLTYQCSEYATSIILASHNMQEVTQLCDRVLVLKDGILIADDSPAALANQATKVRVQLIVDDIKAMEQFLKKNHYIARISHPYTIEIDIDEQSISHFLHSLAKEALFYSHITIEKPTLEDYFLTIGANARSTQGKLQ
jgi:ABC-2 type transport system ATP-binding protein